MTRSLRGPAARGAGGAAGAPRALDVPGPAWLAARMVGWSLVLPVLKRLLPLDRLLRVMAVDGRRHQVDPERLATIARLARRTHALVRFRRADNCLERSLVAFRYLSAAGADPQLVVGFRTPPGGGVEGHVWVTLDGAALHDAPADLATYTPVTTFRAAGGGVERVAAP